MKKVKKLLSAMLVAFALLLIAPVILPGYSNTVDVQAAPKIITLFKGASTYGTKRTLAASNLTWVSSNSKVATVKVLSDSNGKTTLQILPVSAGTAYIRYKKPNSSSYVNQYQINVITTSRASGVRAKNGSYTLKLNGVTSANDIKWSVSNSNILGLSSASKTSVKVTGKAVGTAYVYVSIDGSKKKCTKIKVEDLAISKTSVGLTKGNTYTLKMMDKATNAATKRTVTWSSTNTSVATVTSAGKVTAKAAGTAKVQAVVGGVRYTCDVTVKNPPTAADYMKNLKAKIEKSSKVNSSGNHYIYRGRKITNKDGSTSKHYYYVIYEKSKDRLRFRYVRKDVDTKRNAVINMYIYSPDKSYKTTPSLSITTQKGVSFKTKRSFSDYRKYSNSTNYSYSITKHNYKTLTTTRKNAMIDLSNDYLQYAMKGWNTLLTKNGFTMKQIGFTKF